MHIFLVKLYIVCNCAYFFHLSYTACLTWYIIGCIYFFNKVIFHVLKTSPWAPLHFFFVPVVCIHNHEVAQEIMKITKSLAMEVNKSFFIPNNNKQDGNKTLKTNHKHKTVYMTIYLITSSCHSCVAIPIACRVHFFFYSK